MAQPRQYFERQIKGLDEIMRQMEDAGKRGATEVAKVYGFIASDRIDDMRRDAVDIDYKNYLERIKKYTGHDINFV